MLSLDLKKIPNLDKINYFFQVFYYLSRIKPKKILPKSSHRL